MDPSEPLLTTEDVANFLKVDVVTVRRLVSRNEIGAYRIGNEYRFSMSDVRAFLERQHIPAQPGQSAAITARRLVAGAEPLIIRLRGGTPPKGVTEQADIVVRTQAALGFIERLAGKRKPKGGLLNKLTKRAKNALNASVQEARGLDKPYIGTEHVLLGLLRVKEGSAAKALSTLGVSYDRAREAAASITASETVDRTVPPDELPMTSTTARMIEGAFDEAKKLGNEHVGTEHMLLGLLRLENSVGAGVLQLLDVDVERLRAELAKPPHDDRPATDTGANQ